MFTPFSACVSVSRRGGGAEARREVCRQPHAADPGSVSPDWFAPPEPFLPCPGAEKLVCARLPEAVRRRFWEAMGRNRNLHSRAEKQRFQIPHGWSVFVWATAGVVKSVNIRNHFEILFSLCQEEPEKVPF